MKGERTSEELGYRKEDLKHEDLIYFTFLVSLVLIVISSNKLIINEETPQSWIVSIMIFLIVAVILILALVRFFAIALESLWGRYISMFGFLSFFYSLIVIVFIFLAFTSVLEFIKNRFSEMIYGISSIVSVFLFIIVISIAFYKGNKLILDNLLNTSKYRKINEENYENIRILSFFITMVVTPAIVFVTSIILVFIYCTENILAGFAALFISFLVLIILKFYFKFFS